MSKSIATVISLLVLTCLSGIAQADEHDASVLEGLTITCIAEDADDRYVAVSTTFGCNGDDADADGVCDDYHNCIEVANPDQEDTDDDYFGNRCDPDFDNDGLVGWKDWDYLNKSLGYTRGAFQFKAVLDLNHDGAIGLADKAIFGQFWGMAPGPSGRVEFE